MSLELSISNLSKTYPNPDYYFDPADTAATNPASMTWVGANGIP